MGGRGTNLNIESYLGWSHERRIAEYSAIHEDGNIKYLVQNKGKSVSTPLFSNTAGRLYVTLNAEGKISGITQFGNDHKAVFTIHEPHPTEKKKDVHVHTGYGKNRIRIDWKDMTSEQKGLYYSIKRDIEKHGLAERARGWYAKND